MIDIKLGDCQKLILETPNNSVDLIITSPPYKDEDGFHSIDFGLLFKELHRVAKDKSLFFLNYGHLANLKERPFLVMLEAIKSGWLLNDTITWLKPQYSPVQGHKRVNNLTEFIFVLYKNKMPVINRKAIGVQYEDKSNIGRYSTEDLKCRGNLWKVGYETINKKSQKLHNDRFPLEIPKMCIKLSNIKPNSLILDPFSGSGTTALAAMQLKHNFIGFELNSNHYNNSINRINHNEQLI